MIKNTKRMMLITTSVVVVIAAIYVLMKPQDRGDLKSLEGAQQASGEAEQAPIVERSPSAEEVTLDGGESSAPYGGFTFVEAKVGAERGDPAAQRILSQMYQECFIYNLDAEKNVISQIERVSKEHPRYVPKLKKIRERYETFCPTVDGGRPIPNEAIALWRAQSAKGGDLVARIRVAADPLKKPEQKELGGIVESLRNSKNAEAAFNMSDLAEDAQAIMAGSELAQAFEGPYVGFAWQVAACRSGYDCSDHAGFMRNLCFMGSCDYSNYETLVLEQAIPSGQKRYFENQVNFIMEHFLK